MNVLSVSEWVYIIMFFLFCDPHHPRIVCFAIYLLILIILLSFIKFISMFAFLFIEQTSYFEIGCNFIYLVLNNISLNSNWWYDKLIVIVELIQNILNRFVLSSLRATAMDHNEILTRRSREKKNKFKTKKKLFKLYENVFNNSKLCLCIILFFSIVFLLLLLLNVFFFLK